MKFLEQIKVIVVIFGSDIRQYRMSYILLMLLKLRFFKYFLRNGKHTRQM